MHWSFPTLHPARVLFIYLFLFCMYGASCCLLGGVMNAAQGSILWPVDPGPVYGAGGAERGVEPHVPGSVPGAVGVLGEGVRGALHSLREGERERGGKKKMKKIAAVKSNRVFFVFFSVLGRRTLAGVNDTCTIYLLRSTACRVLASRRVARRGRCRGSFFFLPSPRHSCKWVECRWPPCSERGKNRP